MPTISMFSGMIVRMYFAPAKHPPPHFHVYYAGFQRATGIELDPDVVYQESTTARRTTECQ
jgi:hypothetical protein